MVCFFTCIYFTGLFVCIDICVCECVYIYRNMKEGYKNKKDGNCGGQVRVTQPLSNGGAPSSSFMLNGPPPPPQLQQRSPDFNAMYAQQNNPLIGASTPGMPPGMVAEFEPAAANEHLGGSFF